MKRTLLFIMTAALMISACGESPETISERTIIRQVNQKFYDEATNNLYAPVRTGLYECNDPVYRKQLRALAAADLITYSVDRYCWWEKSKKNVKKAYTVTRGTWYLYKTTEYKWVKTDAYDFCDHFVVSVALTKKGEKMAIEELPQPIEKIDEDLRQPTVDASQYPWNQVDLNENWQDIPNPFIEPEEAAEKSIKTIEKKATTQEEKESEPKKDDTVRMDSLQFIAYSKLNFSETTKYLKAAFVKAEKARNIQIDNSEGKPEAHAEVIIKTVHVTDAGRIMYNLENGYRQLFTVDLDYFWDKGWQMRNDLHEQQ